jgi:hypothetical protein
MHKKHKKKCYLIKNIIKYINSDKKLKDIFNHPNRKYNLKILLKYVIHILITGLSYRSITDFSNSKIHWNTMEVRKCNFHTSICEEESITFFCTYI